MDRRLAVLGPRENRESNTIDFNQLIGGIVAGATFRWLTSGRN